MERETDTILTRLGATLERLFSYYLFWELVMIGRKILLVITLGTVDTAACLLPT
jgi:hypothetical protein